MKNINKSKEETLKKVKLENLLKKLTEVMYRMSLPDGKYEYFSPAAKKVFGYSAKEFLNNPLLIKKIVHPDFVGYFNEKWAELMKGKVPPPYEYKIIDSKGKQRWIRQSNKGVFDSSGNIVAIEGICRDITEQKRFSEIVIAEKEKAKEYLDIAGVMIVIVNSDGVVTLINKRGCEILEYTKKEIIGKNWFDNFLPKRIRKRVKLVPKKLFAGKVKPVEFYENPVLTKSGKEKIISWHTTIIKDKKGNITAILSSGEDITERKKAEEGIKQAKEYAELLYKIIPSGIFTVDNQKRITSWNDRAAEITGYSKEEVIGKKCSIFTEYSCRQKCSLLDDNVKKPVTAAECTVKRKDGEILYISKNVDLLKGSRGNIIGGIGSFEDVTAKKRAEDKLRYLSFHDSLTGIYNRTFFDEELERLQKSRDFPISIISLDIDGLKTINDYLGHSEGDKLLMTLTNMAQKAIRKSDIFARVGGDEFVILLPKTDYDKGRKITDRINEEINNYNNKNESCPLIISTGLATSLNAADRLIETNRRADDAMYNEKNSKKQKSREIMINYLNKSNK